MVCLHRIGISHINWGLGRVFCASASSHFYSYHPILATSARILIPDTITYPSPPLPTAHIIHTSSPPGCDGLRDGLSLPPRLQTRTTTRTTANLHFNGPGPLKRHFLAILALVSAVYNRRSTPLSVLWFTGSLVWFVFPGSCSR